MRQKRIDHSVRNVRVDVHFLSTLAVGSLQFKQTFDFIGLEEMMKRNNRLPDRPFYRNREDSFRIPDN